MSSTHFNQLNPAEDERLACLAEECAEVIQIIAKIQRHGYESHHPDSIVTNRHLLQMEIGDILARTEQMVNAKDIDLGVIVGHTRDKLHRVPTYLHHQPPVS